MYLIDDIFVIHFLDELFNIFLKLVAVLCSVGSISVIYKSVASFVLLVSISLEVV